MLNPAGKTVAPTMEAFQAAAAGADWTSAPDFHVILTDAAGDKSWPVAGSTFILMQSVPPMRPLLPQPEFFDWGYKHGKQMATDLDYVPMPDSVVALIEKTWKDKIKGADSNVSESTRAGKGAPSAPFPFFPALHCLPTASCVAAERPLD